MNVIFLLLVASLAVATAFLVLFIHAVRSGQYDDPVTPALRMLADDEVGSAAAAGGKESTSAREHTQL